MQALFTSAIEALLGLRLSPYTPPLQSPQSTPPAQLPTLHDDILLAVLSCSSRQTIISMMATCHVLYHEGAKIILRNWPVALESVGSEHKARSLLRFLQAEQLSRCSYIRNLYVSMQPMPTAIAKSLADLLPRMTSLRSLFLDIEQALRYHPSLFSAFAALPSIEDLVVTGGERSCELIQSLPSHLVSAQLFFTPPNEEARQRLFSNPAFHPLVMLQRSAPTLKTLTCGFWCDINPRVLFSLPRVSYPNMHTFVFYESRSPTLAPYAKSFPRLAHLAVAETSLKPRWLPAHSQLAARERNLNLARSCSRDAPSWTRLCDYTGRLVDLWFLGLSCNIPRLILDDTPAERPPLALTDVVACARPRELSITFSRCSLTNVLDSDLLNALGTEGGSHLRRLALSIELDAEDRDLDVGQALDDIAAGISRLNLTHVRIELNDLGLAKPDKGAGATKTRSPGPAHTWMFEVESATAAPNSSNGAGALLSRVLASVPTPVSQAARHPLDEFNVQAFMSRLALSIPTLQDAFVSIQSPTTRKHGVITPGATRYARLKRRAPASGSVPMSDSRWAMCKEAGCEQQSANDWVAVRAHGAENHIVNKMLAGSR
ncbi:hypothetical protein GSI_12699 [Ganoderma sinense ZZ0214-1]|uniref:F-box domain-containing protein n=1 Tax=Ganoderma sinense ZZ0214-1 TaxID=1077348 RepID=A0A2G8RTJ5_9APHY|nr:hypothetical protein GSI_12699 [Ganoderma sinense ZZ0214-1]